jgi:ATP-dependent helicase/nuclease subunit A
MPLYIYQSSAGSGKTFTLVKEYLKIVLKNPFDFKHTLAITFTNKATGEMKSRILKELHDLSKGKDSKMKKVLEEEIASAGGLIDIQKNSTQVLENILFNYSRFEISTIDSFFTGIIRSFAKELKLPYNYNVDLDNRKALDYAIEKIFDDFGRDEELASWLEEYAYSQLDNDKGWNIDWSISKLGEEIFKEKFNALSAGSGFSFQELKIKVKELHTEVAKFKNGISSPSKRALVFVEDNNIPFSEFKNGTLKVFQDVINGDFKLSATFLKLATGEKESWCSQKCMYKNQIDNISDQLNVFATEVHHYKEKYFKSYCSANEVLKNIYAYGLLNAISEKVKEYRDENNLMLITDSNLLIKEIVANQEAPFIFEKVGSQYKHILIDEFQDTSDFQWNNLMPLIINSLAGGSNVLIVGDVKQSIYRWRGGNMKLLLTQVVEDLAGFKSETKITNLEKNFRSSKNIVNFNNSFFCHAKDLLKKTEGFEQVEGDKILELAYSTATQTPVSGDEGFVKVKFFAKEEEEENEDEGGEDDIKGWKKYALIETLKTIQQCKTVGFELKDILILLERNEEVSAVSTFLDAYDIPVISQNSLLLNNAPQVKLILNIFRYLSNPDDSVALANILWLHFTLFRLSEIEDKDVHHIFRNQLRLAEDPFIDFPEDFRRNISGFQFKPVYELSEELILAFGLKTETDPFLQSFLDVCLEQSLKGRNSIPSFLEFWDEKKSDLCILTPSGINAVNLLTIHRSKGLESPVVIIPFANFNFKPKPNSTFWTDDLEEEYMSFRVLPLNFTKGLADSSFSSAYYQELLEGVLERLNVTYVGFTRPKERMYLFSERFNEKYLREINSLNKLLYSIFEEPNFEFSYYWDKEIWEFNLGDEYIRGSHKEEDNDVVLFQNTIYSSSSYSEKVNIRSDSGKLFTLLDNRQSQNILIGHKLHAVLEALQDVNSLDQVIHKLEFDGIIAKADIPHLQLKVSNLLKNPLFQSWFEPGWNVFSEREIFFGGRSYKPDRVMTSENKAIIIDYKKDKPNEAYHKQVKKYAELLVIMGYQDIKKYLVYVENEKIEEVE